MCVHYGEQECILWNIFLSGLIVWVFCLTAGVYHASIKHALKKKNTEASEHVFGYVKARISIVMS